MFSRSNAWAFGSIAASPGSTAAYAVRFNGRTWRRVPVPIVAQATSSTGPASIWAVGALVNGGSFALAHWTGRWKTIMFPDLQLPSGQAISQAWVVPDHSGGAWITATSGGSSGEPTGVLLHWTRSGWATIELPVQVVALGPLAPDGQGGLWVTSYPTSLQCTDFVGRRHLLQRRKHRPERGGAQIRPLTVRDRRRVPP